MVNAWQMPSSVGEMHRECTVRSAGGTPRLPQSGQLEPPVQVPLQLCPMVWMAVVLIADTLGDLDDRTIESLARRRFDLLR